ncbi:MAG: hypothetical protein ACFE89_03725 [Candidatus Hodarchaeota archaeon]
MSKKKINFSRIPVVERAALGCRNPTATPGHRFVFTLVTSR